MALAAGDRLGPYEIVSLLGVGGMGEVYRARDSRLSRDVAVKVSGARFNERFEQEARVVAALNHPNVCSLFDVGPDYLVMELVEGATLAERIAKGPVGVEEAVEIARQIAAGLEAAHEKGLVHRDLKPANIKITPSGLVKVLDFGLAKVQAAGEPGARPNDSPTLTMRATEAGMILGTAGYMSPEQARGEGVDRRADIWAYGVVVHEMVTGKTLFQGPTVADTLAAVLVKEPDLTGVPERMRALVSACLERNLKKRLRDIGEVWRFLEAAPAAPAAVAVTRRAWLPWAVAGVAVLGAGALGVREWSRPKPEAVRARFEIAGPEDKDLRMRGFAPFSISPDGKQLVYGAIDRIWIRKMDEFDWRQVAAVPVGNTFFWSRDGRFVVFRSRENLVRMSVTGGTPQVICSVNDGVFNGGFWTADDRVVFAIDGVGIKTVSASGGTPTVIVAGDGSFPYPLPDGDHFVYAGGRAEESGVYVGSLRDRVLRSKVATDAGRQVAYAPGGGGRGHLLYVRGRGTAGTLVAHPFDEKRLETAGDAVPLAEPVRDTRGFSVAAAGTLVLRQAAEDGERKVTMRSADRQGKVSGAIGDFRVGNQGRGLVAYLSPDGTRMVYERRMDGSAMTDLWVLEFARGVSTRLTAEGMGYLQDAGWSADGESVYYAGRDLTIYRKGVLGASEAEMILDGGKGGNLRDLSASGDGEYLMYAHTATQRTGDAHLWVVPLQGPKEARKPFLFLQTKFGERRGRFLPSAKGTPRWVVYTSAESGRDEIYVRAFDPANRTGTPAGEKWQVSRDGGTEPRWRGDGKELFFVGLDGMVMAAEVLASEGQVFRTGPAKALFKSPEGATERFARLGDVSGDGKRFLFGVPEKEEGDKPLRRPPLRVLMNWQAGLGKE